MDPLPEDTNDPTYRPSVISQDLTDLRRSTRVKKPSQAYINSLASRSLFDSVMVDRQVSGSSGFSLLASSILASLTQSENPSSSLSLSLLLASARSDSNVLQFLADSPRC
jgi:hypothetical protein